MMRDDFEGCLRRDCYQVFIMDSPASLPVSMFRHAYIVVNDCGVVTRWDVFHKNYATDDSRGYIHRNYAHPWSGLRILQVPFLQVGPTFRSRCLGMVEGGESTLAYEMVTFINKNGYKYVFWDRYNMVFGPNSNTYVQWFLDHFPQCGITLPSMAIGKGCKKYNIDSV